MSERSAWRRPTGAETIDAVVVLGLTGLASFAFRSSYGGVEYLVLALGAAVLGIVVAHVAVRFDWPLVVGGAIAAVLYVVVGGAAALHQRTIASVVPTPDSMLAAARTAVTGWKELVTTAPPVGRTGDLLALPFLAGMVAGFAGYTLARRLRAAAPLALLPAAVVLGVAIACGTDRPVSVVAHGAVFGAVSVAWLAWREEGRRPMLVGARVDARRLSLGAGLLVVASAGGMAGADRLPFTSGVDRAIWRQTVTPPFDPRQHPSPLSTYRRYVKDVELKTKAMFTVEGLPEGVPVRLATMDAYDGLVWQVSAGDPEDPSLTDSGSFERVGASIAPEYPGTLATVTVVIGAYDDVWVPDVGEVVSLRFEGSAGGRDRDRQLAESFRYNRATDTGAARLRLTTGDRYVMRVRLPTVVDTLAGKPVVADVPRLGPTIPVAEVAQKLAGPDVLAIKDTGQQLDKVRDLFLDGTYSDGDANSGQQQRSRAGHGASRLAEFVGGYPKRPLIGNAEQYAAAYALLFRDLNVPTRVVMGFKTDKASVDAPIEVRAEQVEAWVEVPVRDLGWVAVFPTPDRSHTALTSSSEQQPEPDYRTQNPPPPPLLDPEFDQPATAAGKAKGTKPGGDTPTPPAETGEGVSRTVVIAAGFGATPIVLALLTCLSIVVLKRRRSRRRRRTGAPHERIANGWREVTDLALDRGTPVPATTTRREAAAFVGADAVALAVRADAAVWGGGEPPDEVVEQYWADLVATLKAMRSELGPLERLKCRVSVRSLRRRDSRTDGKRTTA